MERFAIEEVYGMHNMPGMPVGQFGSRVGPIMASTDEFTITIDGRGGHAAQPHRTIDPIVIGSQIVNALQTIASRSVDPLSSVVVSVTKFNAGFAHNIIPEQAKLGGTVRTLMPEVRDLAEQRIKQISESLGTAYGAKIQVSYARNYPVTVNHRQETAHALSAAQNIAGESQVFGDLDPMMGRRGFFLHAARPSRRLYLHRQWRHGRPAQSGLRLQRRGDPAWHLLLGETRRNAAGGVSRH